MADDDITDLTDEEAPASEGKPKTKKGKEPKEPKPSKSVIDDGDKPGKKEKGKKKKGKLLIIALLILVILIAGFVYVELTFNLLGTRDMVRDLFLDVVVWLDPEFRAVDDELKNNNDERVAKLDEREEALDKRDEEITQRESDAITRETQLDRRSTALDLREQQQEQSQDVNVPLFRRDMTEEQLADLQSLSRSYSQMSPEAAAEILVELFNPNDVATILYFMNERNAASILAEMDVDFAARLTEILLG